MSSDELTQAAIEDMLTEMFSYKLEPEYMIIDDERIKVVKEVMDYIQKWHVDLFTPKGLSILFPSFKK